MNKKIQSKKSEIEKGVMSRIKKGEAKMKPQSYYLIVGSLGVLSVLFLSFIASYFMSIMTLWLRIQAAQGPALGAKNTLLILMGVFPWWALIIGALSLICMIIIIKRIGSFYKIRLIYLIPVIVSLFIAISFLLSYSSLPDMFSGRRQNIDCFGNNINCRPSGVIYYRYR
ncbi:MAG: hypothetical protein ACYDH1_18490 [Anaerolineaceae bacterium]